ncbi:MAG: MarR family transcriptional regulator [Methylococcaceae bacterium]|nr:MarR family transcriptional regulator [Methylococcaceae bacterium]
MVDQLLSIETPADGNALVAEAREAALRLAIEQFYFGYRAFTVQPDRILAERGLGRVHHRILYFVGRNPRISVNALLSMLSVSKQALNAPLRQLVELQLVAMDAAEYDKRVRELSLTTSGAELEAQLTGTQMQQLQTVFELVGANAEEGWHQVMRSLSGQG